MRDVLKDRELRLARKGRQLTVSLPASSVLPLPPRS